MGRAERKIHANIQSEKGIRNRQIRSIQTEGHFGDMKENGNFRRFHYQSTEKVYKEFMLYAIGRNINKYHRFLHDEIRKFDITVYFILFQIKKVFYQKVVAFRTHYMINFYCPSESSPMPEIRLAIPASL